MTQVAICLVIENFSCYDFLLRFLEFHLFVLIVRSFTGVSQIHSKSTDELKRLREEIDRIDSELLALLNKRAQLADRIGFVKHIQGLSVHDPNRENEVLTHLKEENKGPFNNQVLERLFRIIFEESRNLQNHPASNGTQ